MKKNKLYVVLRPLIRLVITVLFRPKYQGLDNIPKKGRVVLAGNHVHMFDCLLLICSTKRIVHFLAKAELWQGPQKIIFANMGLIPVNRSIKDAGALMSAIRYLSKDEVIGIFPEGKRNKTKDFLLPLKKGAVTMAQKTNSPIIPFVITGKYKLFNNKLRIRFGSPIDVSNMSIQAANELLANSIKKLKNKNG